MSTVAHRERYDTLRRCRRLIRAAYRARYSACCCVWSSRAVEGEAKGLRQEVEVEVEVELVEVMVEEESTRAG